MQRDKRGRFVKKAHDGTIITLGNKKYKVKPGASQAFTSVQSEYPDFQTWISSDNGKTYLEELSSGLNLFDNEEDKGDKKFKGNFNGDTFFDRTRMANFLELTRTGLGTLVNNKVAERAIAAEKPLLQDVVESHRSVYGNYRAKAEGEKAAAALRKAASTPLTSDGALQQQTMLAAQIKGQEYIDQGNSEDEAMTRQTSEVAWQQEKENATQREAVAMQNRQAMLMSKKNIADIQNTRDSANYSQNISPFLAATEQRWRNKGVERDKYQDYYDDALVTGEVWNTYRDGLSDEQKSLAEVYLTKGTTGVTEYVGEDATKKSEWLALKRIMDNEIIKRKAAIKGAVVNPSTSVGTVTSATDFGIFGGGTGSTNLFPINKKGGTIYKATLTKRSKDNDRGAKSIESSKKIASRLLEKAIDSLYTYDQVELIAKPKRKKRKYQAGGGLPFVGFTPVFATSETGAPANTETKKDSKNADLTTKDILELLKDVDGLPSDIKMIESIMANFLLADDMDPLGLDSSSSIAARYMSLIGKIKTAKTNKEWYDKAYDKLREKGALNELAVDSRGYFIGMDSSGDFTRFSAKQIAEGNTGDYKILTNSELLDLRANTLLAPFNANIIMEAANGISMEQINDHISKVVQGLGSEKNQTQIFGDQSKDIMAGLRQLQEAAKEVGQDLSISQLYEANIFTETQANQASLALKYIFKTLPTNMQALLFAKAGSMAGVEDLIRTLVNSKLSSTTKLEFSPKNTGKGSTSKKTGNILIDGLDLSPAQMLQQGYGERESVLIQNNSSGGLHVEAITMPITKEGNQPVGATTLEGIATSQYGGLLNFNNASMGGKIIPFEGRRNIAVDGSKIYSMYLPIDQEEYMSSGNIIPDIGLIDKVNAINKTIKEKKITDPSAINQLYQDAGLPVYLNSDGTVVPTNYRRFGVLNGTALDNAFGKDFVGSEYLKEINDEDVINGAITIMNEGRGKEDRIKYDAKNFFNFGGLLGDYDSVYQGTIFIPMSNDIFLGIAGSGQTINSTEALDLYERQQQKQRVSATYKNPGQLR